MSNDANEHTEDEQLRDGDSRRRDRSGERERERSPGRERDGDRGRGRERGGRDRSDDRRDGGDRNGRGGRGRNGGGGGGGDDEVRSLFVRGLADGTRSEDLIQAFKAYGDVIDCYLPVDYYTGKSRGFAYIQFADQEQANIAFTKIEYITISGRTLTVEWAAGRRKTPGEMRGRGPRNNDRPRRRSPGDSYRPNDRSPRRRRRSRTRSRSRSRDRSPRRGGDSGRYSNSSRSKYRSDSRDRSRSPAPRRYDDHRRGSASGSARRSGSPHVKHEG
ncbi:uncharacterized protein EV422DRAFT_194436 [Fimicolochytrium jonesii]|uniref:uncharacterized protein n=1 Tax=Fimicolochytrium jonesii TaxID=1396493 RepID=UPI0022FEB94F|nr:uncharacterized protein EV422DRAFT_194436 [Fimicolochytrium jonesii]KAI8818218.1 hypothetical protein EV422DRAFT_194436 [Fimicolochytrium jonesii]